MAQDITPLTGVNADAGAQPSVSSGGRVPFGGFGPSPTPTSQAALGVFAPLDVQGAAPQTKFLAQRLQESLQTLHYPAMEAERADARQKEQAGEDEGAAAATIGKVDPKLAAANSAYQVGAARVVAQTHARQAVLGAFQQYADPKSGWNKLPLEDSHPGAGDGLASKVDQFFAQQLGGLEKDPVTAAAIAPLVEHAQNEIIGRAYSDRMAANQSAAIDNATSLAAAQAATAGTVSTGKVFDYDQQLDTLKGLFAGDGVKAQAALSSALIDKAVVNHDPRILDMIRPAPGAPALSPQIQLKIAEARETIGGLIKQDGAAAQTQRAFSTLADYDQMLHNKVPVPLSRLNADLQAGNITAGQANAYYEKSLDLKNTQDHMSDAAQLLASGTPWYTQVGVLQPDGKRLTKQDFVNAATDQIDRYVPDHRPAAAVAMTRDHGLIYPPLQATLNNEPLNTAQGIKDVLGAYQGMNAADQTVTAQYFNDPKRRAEVDQLLRLREQGMSDQDIASYVQQHGTKAQTADALKFSAGSVARAVGNWKVSGGLIGAHHLQDFANSGDILARLTQNANAIAATGLYADSSAILAQAQKQTLEDSYEIDLPNGHSLLVPRHVGDPPASESQAGLKWFYHSQVAPIVREAGYHGDPSDVVLAPNPGQPGTFSLIDHTGYPIDQHQYTLTSIVTAYHRSLAEHVAAKQADAAKIEQDMRYAEANFSVSRSAAKQ